MFRLSFVLLYIVLSGKRREREEKQKSNNNQDKSIKRLGLHRNKKKREKKESIRFISLTFC
jgi:hypothetical protein